MTAENLFICREILKGGTYVLEKVKPYNQQTDDALRKSHAALLEALKRVFAHKDDNLFSSYPWYGIVRESKIGVLGEVLLAGPFFNRQQAQDELERRRYHYGAKAITWEFSGCYSKPWCKFYDEAERSIATAEALNNAEVRG